MKKPIKSFSISELKELFQELKQPSFRVGQLLEWLYLRHASSYDEMLNLPIPLRKLLAEEYPLYLTVIIDTQVSQDGTRKYILGFHDGLQVEMVSLPSDEGKHSVCCSTQVGCAMACSFCATGKEGFSRNLSVGEIVDQVLIAQQNTGLRVSSVVAMGQGEPFLNYDATVEALKVLNHVKLLNIGARHITVSTCGILPGVKRFSAEIEQFTLAISLHSAIQATRNEIMPRVDKYSLSELKKVLREYIAQTNRRVTLEYALIDGVNDSKDDLKALEGFCEGLLCHVNLIPLNKVAGSSFQPSPGKLLNMWYTTLNHRGIETTIRKSRGSDIAGACGQLKNKQS